MHIGKCYWKDRGINFGCKTLNKSEVLGSVVRGAGIDACRDFNRAEENM